MNQKPGQEQEIQNQRKQDEERPEQELNDQDPGERQKRNQNDQKDDPLAAWVTAATP